MGQASLHLRRMTNGFSHWCPGCEEMHAIYTSKPNLYADEPVWSFDGNLDKPTFSPSVHIRNNSPVGFDGKPNEHYQPDLPTEACHYFLRAAELQFLSDCTHALKGQTVPLPELPDHMKDGGGQ